MKREASFCDLERCAHLADATCGVCGRDYCKYGHAGGELRVSFGLLSLERVEGHMRLSGKELDGIAIKTCGACRDTLIDISKSTADGTAPFFPARVLVLDTLIANTKALQAGWALGARGNALRKIGSGEPVDLNDEPPPAKTPDDDEGIPF